MAVVEYFYATHSVYAYIGSARFMEIINKSNKQIIHKPFDLPKGIIGAGSTTIGERSPAHLDYFFRREVERWSEYRSVSVTTFLPTHHFNSLTPSSTMLIASIELGINVDQLAHAMMKSHWLHDADLADKTTLKMIALSVGIEPDPILDLMETDKILEIYKKNTDEAIKRSVFGSPTYILDGDMFYGQDRLELVERALIDPFQ